MKFLKFSFLLFGIIAVCSFVMVFPSGSQEEDVVLPTVIEEEMEQENFISLNDILSNNESEIEECKKLDKYIEKFLHKWEIKGASLTVLKDEKLVYSKGYGWADEEKGIKADAGNIFRVASLSKLITAAAIMKLEEDSLLHLSDKVFGEGAILDCPQFNHYKDKRVANITVDNLLRHQGGFSTYRGDPLFTTREIMMWEHLDTIPDMNRVIEFGLSQRLGYTPGKGSRYSNLGYLILSKVIEVKSGMSYENYCQKKILNPAGCYDMHLAKNTYENKYPNEVRYYEANDAKPILAFDNSGKELFRSYGGNNIEGLYGAGGWVASSCEYAKFVASINKGDSVPDILNPDTIDKMIPDSNNEKPIGWVRATKGSDWMRTGTLAGTSAVAKKQKNGYIWVFITNTSSWKGSNFTKYIDRMYHTASAGISWPDRDLFNYENAE